MEKLIINKQQARRFMLSHQGLWPPYSFKGKSGILDFIKRVGSIQFDPLNIAGRNPEIVLQARIAGFTPQMLNELLYKERRLLDGWDKMMCIYSLEDWQYFKRYRDAALNRYLKSNDSISEVLPQMRKLIEEKGPLSSLDLDFDNKVNWAWGPTRLSRAALEGMYFWGELVIHHKINTRRVFDFAYHHIPKEILEAPEPNETDQQYREWHVLRRIGSVGLLWGRSGDAWIGIKGTKSKERSEALSGLLDKKKIQEVYIEDMTAPMYIRTCDRERLNSIVSSDKVYNKAAVIAPLDNLIWDRRLTKEIFDFDYRWEVYKPEKERQYGYYVLPVLYRDKFAARFEPARDKETGGLIIKNWWWEKGVKQTKLMQEALCDCFKRFCRFLDTDVLVISDTAKESDISWLEV